MGYKIGDILICKKNTSNITKGKYYVIHNTHIDSVYIIDDKGNGDGWFNANNYFYTIGEMRLMKLKRINEL